MYTYKEIWIGSKLSPVGDTGSGNKSFLDALFLNPSINFVILH